MSWYDRTLSNNVSHLDGATWQRNKAQLDPQIFSLDVDCYVAIVPPICAMEILLANEARRLAGEGARARAIARMMGKVWRAKENGSNAWRLLQ
jgi:hypothetical protein